MKIICLADIHFRESNPVNRIDNYLDTLCGKLEQINNNIAQLDFISKADEKIVVIIAGDIFHHFRCSDSLKARVINVFHQFYSFADEILVVAGQHDQRWHTQDLDNTPLGILIASQVVTLLNDRPFSIKEEVITYSFYGSSYGEEIPRIREVTDYNILAIHRMVSDANYWNGNVEYTSCKSLLKEAKGYSLIISGDNHRAFNYQDRILNPGSVMRSSIDQKDHRPCYFIFNNGKIEQIFFDVELFEKVMRLDEVAESKELDSKLMSFVDEINLDYEFEELKFIDNVRAAINKAENEEVKSILLECIKDLE